MKKNTIIRNMLIVRRDIGRPSPLSYEISPHASGLDACVYHKLQNIEHDFSSPHRGIVATRRAAWPKLLGNVKEYSVGGARHNRPGPGFCLNTVFKYSFNCQIDA